METSKTLDTLARTTKLTPKVNFKQYLTNRHEPADLISDINLVHADSSSGIIENTYFQKKAFRHLASSLRIAHGV